MQCDGHVFMKPRQDMSPSLSVLLRDSSRKIRIASCERRFSVLICHAARNACAYSGLQCTGKHSPLYGNLKTDEGSLYTLATRPDLFSRTVSEQCRGYGCATKPDASIASNHFSQPKFRVPKTHGIRGRFAKTRSGGLADLSNETTAH